MFACVHQHAQRHVHNFQKSEKSHLKPQRVSLVCGCKEQSVARRSKFTKIESQKYIHKFNNNTSPTMVQKYFSLSANEANSILTLQTSVSRMPMSMLVRLMIKTESFKPHQFCVRQKKGAVSKRMLE